MVKVMEAVGVIVLAVVPVAVVPAVLTGSKLGIAGGSVGGCRRPA